MPFVDVATDVATGNYTGTDVIEEVSRLLLSGQREEMNLLSGSVTTGATTLTFKYDLGGIRPGALVDIDMETYRVWAVDTANKTATVQPSMLGTDSDTHADGALVYVNPRMSRPAIFKSINDEILSLQAEGLWAMKYYEFTYVGAQEQYDLPGDNIIDVYQVTWSVPGPTDRWALSPAFEYYPSSDLTTFGSGQSVFVPLGMPGRSVRVLYKAGFSKLSSPEDDLVAVGGLPQEMHDILPYGVLARIGATRELKRNFLEAQSDPKRAEEVPAGATLNSFKYVQQMRDARIAAERARLLERWPILR